MQKFDLAIIGGGSAGYTAAVKAGQAGLKTCCIEKNSKLGGTCLNVGCIPSKSLLNFAQKYSDIKNSKYEKIGLKIENVKLDLNQMISKKDAIIEELEKGIRFLFKQNKVTLFQAEAHIIDAHNIELYNTKEQTTISAKNIIIATGSSVRTLEAVPFDKNFILSSSDALSMKKIPSEIVIIGGGYIGLELGSLYNRLGSKVSIIESNKTLLTSFDHDIVNILQKALVNQGIEFVFDAKIENTKIKNSIVETSIRKSDGKVMNIQSVQVLLSVGRVSNTDFLKKSKIQIEKNPQGGIHVNKYYQTNIENIYAIGDVIEGPMLAHKAEHEALEVIDIIKNGTFYIKEPKLIPSVVYTNPEVASVGHNESELKLLNIPYKVGKSYFKANGRAHAMLSKEGLVKILFSEKEHKILGAVIIGPEAGTLIAELVAYMEFQASAEDIAFTIHSHPSLNEAIKAAAQSVAN